MLIMYVWSKLPGNAPTRALILTVIAVLVFLFMMQVVMPIVSPMIFNQNPSV